MRNESGTHTLNLVGPLLTNFFPALGCCQEHLFLWFYCHCNEVGFQRRETKFFTSLDELRNTSHCTSRSYSTDKNINSPVRVCPNFWACSFAMDFRIGWIFELLQHDGIVSYFTNDFFSLGKGTRNCCFFGCKYNFASQSQQHHATFHTHGFWHGQNATVPTFSCDKGQSNSSISASWFHQNGFSWCKEPLRFGIINHGTTQTILDGRTRTKGLHLAI
mmetsp:Transcript_21715/g.32955  ORF Transcript_21715/g.32955 Transcript_21715/m.32955 type:complete len:218 (+) Transcript_21715:421-1074(+)